CTLPRGAAPPPPPAGPCRAPVLLSFSRCPRPRAHPPLILEPSTGRGTLSCTGERTGTGRWLQDQRLPGGGPLLSQRGGAAPQAERGSAAAGLPRGRSAWPARLAPRPGAPGRCRAGPGSTPDGGGPGHGVRPIG